MSLAIDFAQTFSFGDNYIPLRVQCSRPSAANLNGDGCDLTALRRQLLATTILAKRSAALTRVGRFLTTGLKEDVSWSIYAGVHQYIHTTMESYTSGTKSANRCRVDSSFI